MKKIFKFIKNNYLFFVILFFGFILRVYKINETFVYGHDHDLTSWFVKDVVVNHHFRLIGQQTSIQGLFIGPIFYYLAIPFYVLFKFNPVGLAWYSIYYGVVGIISSYYCFSRMYGKRAGLISSFIYSFSIFIINNDREAVPTTPVLLWTVWFLYSLNLILKKDYKKGLLLSGILVGLIWHLNMALIILSPLVLISLFISKWKFSLKQLFLFVVPVAVLISPFVMFELKHNFIQTKSFLFSISSGANDPYSGIDKVKRVFFILNKNISNLYFGHTLPSPYVYILLFVILSLLSFLKNKITLFLWYLIFFVVFISFPKNISEYYLNGLFAVNLLVICLMFNYMFSHHSKILRYLSYLALLLFGLNTIKNYERNVYINNGFGYREKMELATIIKSDMIKKSYDCAGISYITSPGYNLGSRYFFYIMNIKLNKISDKIPVYTIVFPLEKDSVKSDIVVGHAGLIFPSKITNIQCEQDDYNLTEPMWGFDN